MAAPFAVPHSLVSKISEMFHQDDSMVSRGVLVIESRFKFVQLKGQSLFQGETITNSKNTLMKFKEPLDQFQQNLAQSILGWKGL